MYICPIKPPGSLCILLGIFPKIFVLQRFPANDFSQPSSCQYTTSVCKELLIVWRIAFYENYVLWKFIISLLYLWYHPPKCPCLKSISSSPIFCFNCSIFWTIKENLKHQLISNLSLVCLVINDKVFWQSFSF